VSVHSLFLQTGISVCCINKRERLKYERNERASALSGEFSPDVACGVCWGCL